MKHIYIYIYNKRNVCVDLKVADYRTLYSECSVVKISRKLHITKIMFLTLDI